MRIAPTRYSRRPSASPPVFATAGAIDPAGYIFVTQHGRDQLHSNWPDPYQPAEEASSSAGTVVARTRFRAEEVGPGAGVRRRWRQTRGRMRQQIGPGCLPADFKTQPSQLAQ
jgi:hypothetical protein